MTDDELRRAIESIKLRAPIEEVARERLPSLRKAGALWVACCPFHDEKTPSFKIDPRRQSWHCYGACSTGGDVIGFIERLDNLPFFEVLEILAARTGVELPRRQRPRGGSEDEEALAVLAEAESAYRQALAGREGREGRDYLAGRGLSTNTWDAFGLGWAPSSGRAMQELAARSKRALELFRRVGLVRVQDSGTNVDFFRGRLMIPIRDWQGRTVGFGARRLGDRDESGPKYINTAETPWFKKKTLIYGIDRARDEVRRSGRLILVEGYTDVMAAHQAGVSNVAAVMGTATTEDHAALIRRSGARRLSLVFDGDEAGRKAAWRGLQGLLGLDLEIDVVCLPSQLDPCDLLVRDGGAGFLAHLELAQGWFEFVVEGLADRRGIELAREIERVLELLLALRSPVHQEARLIELAERVSMPADRLREQWQLSPARRRARQAEAEAAAARPGRAPGAAAAPAPAPAPALDPRSRRAWESILGAVLADPSLLPLARAELADCPDPELAVVFGRLLELYEDVEAVIDESSVLAALGEDPARTRVVPAGDLGRTAESARTLLEGALGYLRASRIEGEKRALAARITELERASTHGDSEAQAELMRALTRLSQVHRQGGPLPNEPARTHEGRES